MKEYEKTNHHIVICSANYLRLKKILKNFSKTKIELNKKEKKSRFKAKFLLKKLSKHTTDSILEFSNLDSSFLNVFNIEINIYHDVELAEVKSLNGFYPNKFPFQSENIPKSEDEKSQQNRFLTEVLDTILTGGFYEE
mgnify:FL=1|tara:strand:- start:309 stop:722 length:414 start_codon:yes stop_codon:yes gene_type:complete